LLLLDATLYPKVRTRRLSIEPLSFWFFGLAGGLTKADSIRSALPSNTLHIDKQASLGLRILKVTQELPSPVVIGTEVLAYSKGVKDD
jgi:hypothetical protein